MTARHKEAYTNKFQSYKLDILYGNEFTKTDEKSGTKGCHAWVMKPIYKVAKE